MAEKDVCDIFCYDERKVRHVRQALERQPVQAMAAMCKGLADETRMKVVCCLCEEEELCVCDIANIIGSSTATASHHLRALKQLGLAKHRKEGKLVFYSLEDDRVRQLVRIASIPSRELVAHGT